MCVKRFLTSICGLYGLKKNKALSVGPSHSDQYTIAQLVDHAANYWKHSNEWNYEKKHNRQIVIEKALKSVGADRCGAPLMGVLTEISPKKESGFESLVDELERWAYQVEEQCN